MFAQLQLLDWILIISVLFVIVAVIIGFVLLALIRRSRSRKELSEQATQETPIIDAAPSADADTEDTMITTPKSQEGQLRETSPDEEPAPPPDKDETSPSLPVVKTVDEPVTLPVSGQRPANVSWQISGLTDVGLKRELNEDNLIMIEDEMDGLGPYGIYIVADGLGGHVAGEVASQLTIETIQQRYEKLPPTAETASFIEWLKDSALAANEAVLQRQRENSNNKKMGSTLVMAMVVSEQAYIINVGDSRAYRITNEQIEQISVDHSLVERLVQIGQITREEARTHKQRNVIYSTIGEKQKMEIGTYHVALNPGDRLLLCSDGLSGMVTDEELLKISRHQPDPAQANQMMVESAKQAGGHDNITAIVIQIDEIQE